MEKRKLAVIFPGMGYHADKPLLYYSGKIAKQEGYEIITLDYKLNGQKKDKAHMEQFLWEALSYVEMVLENTAWQDYIDILFLSKSIGTAVAVEYAYRHLQRKVRHVFYTPLAQTFFHLKSDCPAIAFTGTKDLFVEAEDIRNQCEQAGIPLFVVEQGNHSLETGQIERDIEHIRYIMQQTAMFVQKEE